ncbi:MAG: MBL fold metallo-hydrolase [Chloroflexota bacterium]
MIQEIMPGLYQIQVPFSSSPLRNINIYIVKNGTRALMVDTGINLDECRDNVLAGLKSLGVDLSQTDFFITHMHPDHTGLLPKLVTQNSVVYFSRADFDLLNRNLDVAQSWERRVSAGARNGFPGDELRTVNNHPIFGLWERTNHSFQFLKQGDVIDFGDYHFLAIETPGHTKGHMCLYEPERKLFLSGDHILADISPNVSSWSAEDNPLADYLASLDKVSRLDVSLVLPGHRNVFTNMRERIGELKRHHEVRAGEAFSILGRGRQTAYQVASQMTWDLRYDTWEAVPVWQKMFATGETIAHLKYLESEGKVKQEIGEREITYSVKEL